MEKQEANNNNRIRLRLRRGGNSETEILVGGKREENVTDLTAAGGSCQQR